MAKKIPSVIKGTKPKDEIGNISGLDDWESSLDNFSFDDPIDEGSRKPKSAIKQGITSAFHSTLRNLGPSILSKTRKSLPDVDKLINEASQVVNETTYLKNDFISDVTPGIQSLKQVGRALNSKLGQTLPKGLHSKLEKLFEEEDRGYSPSKEETENLYIQENLSKVFLEQAKHQDIKDKEEAKDRFLDRTLSQFRHDQVAQLLNQIRVNTTSERLFRKSVQTAYYKKDLELKYKHLFVAKETLATLQATSKVFDERFKTIAYNTSLPDIQKKKLTESIKQVMEQSLGQKVSDLGTSAIKNLVNKAKTQSSGLSSNFNLLANSLSMITSFGAGSPISSLIGDFAGDYLAGILGSKISDKAIGKGGSLRGNAKVLDRYAKNFPGLLGSKLRDMQGTFAQGSLLSELFSMAVPDKTKITNTFKDPLQPTSFDNATRTSIVSVIPGYLARILQQITNLATGRNNQLQLFDHKTNTFKAKEQMQQEAFVDMYRNQEGRGALLGRAVSSISAAYDKTQGFSRQARKDFRDNENEIRKVVANSNAIGTVINYDRLKEFATKYNYDLNEVKSKAPGTYNYLTKLFRNVKESNIPQVTDILLKTVYKKTNTGWDTNHNATAKALADSGLITYIDSNRDITKSVRDLASTGQATEVLGGLIDYSRDGSTINLNQEKQFEIYSKIDEASYSKSYKEQRKIDYDWLKDTVAGFSNERHIKDIYDILTGNKDISSIKDKSVLQNARDLANWVVSEEDLRNVLDSIHKFAKNTSDTSKIRAYIEKLKSQSPSERLRNFYNTSKKKVVDFFTEPDKDFKLKLQAKQDEEAWSKFNSTDDLSTIFRQDSILGVSDNIKVNRPTSTITNVINQSPSSKIVDAIEHFEQVFVDYTKQVKSSIPFSTIGGTTPRYEEDSIREEKKQYTSKKSRIIDDFTYTHENLSSDKESYTSGTKKKEKAKRTKKVRFKRVFNERIFINGFSSNFKTPEWLDKIVNSDILDDILSFFTGSKKKEDIKDTDAKAIIAKLKDVEKEDVITALITLQDTAEEKFEKFKEENPWFESKYKKFKESFEQFGSTVNSKLNDYRERFKKAKKEYTDKINEQYTKFREGYDSTADSVKAAFTSGFDKAKTRAQATFGSASSTASDFTDNIRNTFFKQKYIDIFSYEIITNKDEYIDPIITAQELESGEVFFHDGKVIPDAYSIDRPVVDKSGNIRITKAMLRKGIYDKNGNDITKRSLSWRTEQKVAEATEAVVRTGIKTMKFGIKYGFKALMFGLGTYGKMYYYLGKYGFRLAKGLTKGIAKGLYRGLFKSKEEGGGYSGVLKGLVKGFGSGFLGKEKYDKVTDKFDKAKDFVTGMFKGKGFASADAKTDTVNTENIDREANNFDTDNNDATYEGTRPDEGVRSHNREKTPEEQMAENTRRMADALDPKDGKKPKGLFGTLLDSIKSGFGLFSKLGSGILSAFGILTGTIKGGLKGIFNVILPIGKILTTIGSALGNLPGLGMLKKAMPFTDKLLKLAKPAADVAKAAMTGTSGAALGVGAGVAGYMAANKIAHDKLKEENPELYEKMQEGKWSMTDSTSTSLDSDVVEEMNYSELQKHAYKESDEVSKARNNTEELRDHILIDYNRYNRLTPKKEEKDDGSLTKVKMELYGVKSNFGNWFQNDKASNDVAINIIENKVHIYNSKSSDRKIPDIELRKYASILGFHIFTSLENIEDPEKKEKIEEDNALRMSYFREWFEKRFILVYATANDIITRQRIKWLKDSSTINKLHKNKIESISDVNQCSVEERKAIAKLLKSEVKLDNEVKELRPDEQSFMSWYSKKSKKNELEQVMATVTNTDVTDASKESTPTSTLSKDTTPTGTSSSIPVTTNTSNAAIPTTPINSNASDNIKANTNTSYSKLDELYDKSIQHGKHNQLGDIVRPTDSNVVTSPFGLRNIKKGSTNHQGIDLRARDGANIYAMSDGKVVSISRAHNAITIAHLSGYITKYLHNSKVLVKTGQVVKAGDIIAKAGGIGRSGFKEYDSHLHFEIHHSNSVLDPEKFLKAAGITLVRKGEQGNSNMAPMSDAGTEDVSRVKSVLKSSDIVSSVNENTPTPTGTPTSSNMSTPNTSSVKIDGTSPSLSNESAYNTASNNNTEMSNVNASGNYTPNPNELGGLSAKFESGGKGSEAINPNDNGNGASYGKYQINEGSKTFSQFLQFCYALGGSTGKEVHNRLSRLKGKARQDEWRKLAQEGKIQKLEHDFIEKYKYNAALSRIAHPELVELINKSNTLKDVLWSTAVQHGEGDASKIFNNAWKSGMTPDAFIRAVYSQRSAKAPMVKTRFKEELGLALSGIQKEGIKVASVTTPTSTNTTGTSTSTANVASNLSNVTSSNTSVASVSVKTPSTIDTSTDTKDTSSASSSTSTTTTKETKKRDINTILEELLAETKKHTPALETINTSITTTSDNILKSTETLVKAYGNFSSSSNSSLQQFLRTSNSSSSTPNKIPDPAIDVAKKS